MVTVNGLFEIRGTLPEGYRMSNVMTDDAAITAYFDNEDPAKPYFILVIAYLEEYADVERMNDMSEKDRMQLLGDDPTLSEKIELMETDFGTQVMILRSNDAEDDFACFVSVYKGYEVGINMFPGEAEDRKLTSEQIQLAMKFLSDMEFVPVGER